MSGIAFRPRIALLATATLLLLSGITQAQQSPAQGLVDRAMAQIENSKWDAALQLADQAIKADAKNAGARVARGMALNGKGQYDAAIKEFDWVTEQGGRDDAILDNRAAAYAERSLSLYQKGEYLEAINSAYFSTLERGTYVPAHNARARAYIAREQFDKAIGSANRAIRYDDKSAEGYAHRGYAYAGKGNSGQALKDLDKAIELDANLAVAYQRRGAVHASKGDVAKADADLNKALSLKPNDIDALCDRAYVFGLKRDMTKAMADLDQAVKLRPNYHKPHLLRGQALLAQGKFDSSIASLNQAIKLNPKHSAAYCYRGYAQQAKKKYSQAEKDFTQAIELNPAFSLAYTGRSQAYKKLGKHREARLDLNKVKEIAEPKKKAEPKEAERFTVQSKEVDPNRLVEALTGAKRIDQMVAANYEKHGVKPNPKTTDAQFLRRIYLDITGAIPSYQATRRFLTSTDPNKRQELIDKLLSSDGYASHFFNYWADTLRYTDSLNNNVRGEHYRQWIKQSLAENKPWDEMVHEMISAEGLIWENPATGYLQRDANMPLDNMNNTVRIFLGTRIGCAQCHDHPFDRWTQKEFYQMAAFTYGTLTRTGGGDTRYWKDNPNSRLQEQYEEIEQEEEDRRRNSYRFRRLIGYNMQIVNDQVGRKIRLPKDYQYDNAKPNEVILPKTLFGQPVKYDPKKPPRHGFAKWLTSKDNPRFAKTIANRLWKRAFGVGQIEPVDDMMDGTVAENPELMAFLESEMKRLDFDMKQYLRMIFNSETYQREASSHEVHPGEPYHFPGPILRRMSAEQIWDSFLVLAVVDPDEYREPPATVNTSITGVDLNSITAPELLDAMKDNQDMDRSKRTWQRKYQYKGALLARASELPSPMPANHFLRIFGQSNRELISASSKSGSVPQVLFMFNGPISHMMLEANSTMYNNVTRTRSATAGVKVVFMTILNREPDAEEQELAINEIKENGPPGYGNVIWSLVNTREFLFIQ